MLHNESEIESKLREICFLTWEIKLPVVFAQSKKANIPLFNLYNVNYNTFHHTGSIEQYFLNTLTALYNHLNVDIFPQNSDLIARQLSL